LEKEKKQRVSKQTKEAISQTRAEKNHPKIVPAPKYNILFLAPTFLASTNNSYLN